MLDLELDDDFKINEIIEHDDNNIESIDVYIKSIKGILFCPHCNSICYEHSTNTKKVRDLNRNNKKITLFIEVKKYNCPICKKVITQRISFVKKSARVTERLREYIKNQNTKSITQLANELYLDKSTISRIKKQLD